MALYAIGDIQGCYDSLQRLLEKISFDPASDRLWFTGDLVNRGPRSADVVRLVASLGNRAVVVLGNHDLHLLAIAAGAATPSAEDSLHDILTAHDSEYLLSWISRRPLFHHDPEVGYSMVHAGLLPQWSITDALALAHEVEAIVRGPGAIEFFRRMYGETPLPWTDSLSGWNRLRVIVDGFTRVRFCHSDGRMDYEFKGPLGSQACPLLAWFQIPGRRSAGQRIVFGHWSVLGLWHRDDVIGLDTGCLWGRRLTAARLDQQTPQFISVACPMYRR